jgi:hypothetical protein
MSKLPKAPREPARIIVPAKAWYYKQAYIYEQYLDQSQSTVIDLQDLTARGVTKIHLSIDYDGDAHLHSEETHQEFDNLRYERDLKVYNDYLAKQKQYEIDLAAWEARPEVQAKIQADKQKEIEKLEKQLKKLKGSI